MNNLPESVQSLISASNQLNNHTKAVEELVYNALDAGATSIAIRLNIEENIIQVIDNGCGVSNKDIKYIGQNYMTSKFVDLSTLKSAPNKYGFRGQSIANLVHVSKSVTITSRHESSKETWEKIFEHGREKQIFECNSRPSKGTTVELRGFLYNLKIKRKDTWNDLQSIKIFLEHISLVHSNISISLRDDLKNEIIFKMHKNRDLYQTLSTLYHIEKDDVKEFKVEKNEYKVRGILGNSDKEIDRNYIFLNGKYISGASKLHKTVSSYIKKHFNFKDNKIKKSKNNNDGEMSMLQNKITFYFIFVTCPYMDYNLSNSPKQSVLEFKDWNQVNKLLEKLIKFSAGDVNLKGLVKDNKPSRQKDTSNTKEEVKKIMEKFLGNLSKKSKISHVHKSIKGKLIKRNKRQPPLKRLISKVIHHNKTNNNTLSNSSNSDKIKDNTTNNESLVEMQNSRIKKKKKYNIMKPQTQKNAISSNTKKHSKRYVKKIHSPQSTLLLKNNISADNNQENMRANYVYKSRKPKTTRINLLKIFQKNSEQRRSNKLYEQPVEKSLHKETANNDVHVSDIVQISNISENNRNVSVRKRVNEIVIHRYLPKSKMHKLFEDDNNYHIDANQERFHSNYDLLTTILKTQKDNNEQKRLKYDSQPLRVPLSPLEPNSDIEVYKTLEVDTKTDLIEPLVTFQSHNYFDHKSYSTGKQTICRPQWDVPDNDIVQKKVLDNDFFQLEEPRNDLSPIEESDVESQYFNRKIRNFITKQSKDNFNSGHKCKITKRNLRQRYSKKLTSNTEKKSNDYSKPFRFNDFIGTTEKSYTIDFTDSNNHKLMDTRNSVSVVESNSIKNTFSMNIEETWTQSANYEYNHENEMTNRQMALNATFIIYKTTRNNYFIKNDINVSKYGTYTTEDRNRTIAEDNIDLYNSNNQNYIFVSKDHDNIEQTIDPMTVCETILESQELQNKELEVELPINKSIGSLDINLNKSCNERQIYEDIRSFTDITLFCDQKNNNMAHKSVENIDCFSIPNTEFQTSYIDTMFRLDTFKNNAPIENIQNDILNEVKSSANIVEKAINYDDFNFKTRPGFLPKGMSQIFENCHSKNKHKYNHSRDYYEDDMYNNFAANVRNNAEVFEPKIQEDQDRTTKAIEKVNKKLKKDKSSLKFDGESLKHAKVLGQVDDKFIAAIIKSDSIEDSSEFLVLFDQHAVHERIRLENNLSEYLVDNQWVSTNIDEVTLKISKDEALFLHNYKDKFTQLGLEWTILNYDKVSFSSIPAAILGKNAREVDKVIKAVKNLITEEINMITMQNGCVSLYPKSIMDLVFSEACRYAIKFGEKLSKDRCVELLNILSECKTPFQCAHGRPAMAVIMEISLYTANYKVKNVRQKYDAGLSYFKAKVSINYSFMLLPLKEVIIFIKSDLNNDLLR